MQFFMVLKKVSVRIVSLKNCHSLSKLEVSIGSTFTKKTKKLLNSLAMSFEFSMITIIDFKRTNISTDFTLTRPYFLIHLLDFYHFHTKFPIIYALLIVKSYYILYFAKIFIVHYHL